MRDDKIRYSYVHPMQLLIIRHNAIFLLLPLSLRPLCPSRPQREDGTSPTITAPNTSSIVDNTHLCFGFEPSLSSDFIPGDISECFAGSDIPKLRESIFCQVSTYYEFVAYLFKQIEACISICLYLCLPLTVLLSLLSSHTIHNDEGPQINDNGGGN